MMPCNSDGSYTLTVCHRRMQCAVTRRETYNPEKLEVSAMSNGVFTHEGTIPFNPFNAWNKFGEIAATAASKLTEQQLSLAGALLNIGSSQLKLFTESKGAGDLWIRPAKLASDCGDLVAEHQRKVTEVFAEAAGACFETSMSLGAQLGNQLPAALKATASKREAA